MSITRAAGPPTAGPTNGVERRALVIDCDPGIDDAVGLALAVASPEIDLLAVTTVAGNAPLAVTTANARGVLALLGRPDVPVFPGAARALVRQSAHNRRSPHGTNGIGGVDLPAVTAAQSGGRAVEALARLLGEARPRSIVIAALGPLTNLALLISLYPELTDRIDRIVVMGGSMSAGNITPVAEFNTWFDPEAAQRVLADSDLDVTTVGLDVTRLATVDDELVSTLARRGDAGAALASMVTAYLDRRQTGWSLHDVLAVATVIEPAIVTTTTATLEVVVAGPARGQTIYALDELRHRYATDDPDADPPDQKVQVAIDLDISRFRLLVADRVAAARPLERTGRP